MKTKILTYLRDEKGYLSGQELCNRLGVSRTAVWKVIKQLQEEGYRIEAVKNKGYYLQETPDLLSASEITSRLTTQWAGRQLTYLEKTTSTNSVANKYAEDGKPHGTLIVADLQEQGKGRRGRGWYSGSGVNIYMTLLLRPVFSPDLASMLTLLMALSVSKALQKCCSQESEHKIQIKWPNDILCNGKKVCGILTEMSAQMDFINHVVIGVGINVNQTEIPENIINMATSLQKETGEKFQRSILIADIMKNFEEYYKEFEKIRSLCTVMDEYNKELVNCEKMVKVLGGKEDLTGIAKGINEKGELLILEESGIITPVFAGEVSVRGMFGYV